MSIFGPGALPSHCLGPSSGHLNCLDPVSEPEAVLAGRLSADLRTALLLILRVYYPSRVPVRVVARPEIFTHGDAERWLRARLDNVTQHLCISDGTTIKLLPGCQTRFLLSTRHLPKLHCPATAIRSRSSVGCARRIASEHGSSPRHGGQTDLFLNRFTSRTRRRSRGRCGPSYAVLLQQALS